MSRRLTVRLIVLGLVMFGLTGCRLFEVDGHGPIATLEVVDQFLPDGRAGAWVTFSVEGKVPEGKQIVRWALDYGDGQSVVQNVVLPTLTAVQHHSYASGASGYTAELTIEDEDGIIASDSVTVSFDFVLPCGSPGISALTANGGGHSPVTVEQGEEVVFEFSAVAGFGGNLCEFRLDFGEGDPVLEEVDTGALSVQYTYEGYSQPGIYLAKLTVWDDQTCNAAGAALLIKVVEAE